MLCIDRYEFLSFYRTRHACEEGLARKKQTSLLTNPPRGTAVYRLTQLIHGKSSTEDMKIWKVYRPTNLPT